MIQQLTQTTSYTRAPWINTVEKTALRFWWVVLFLLLCYMVYERAIKRLDDDKAALNRQWEQLQTQRYDAFALRQRLEREIVSKGDPAYIELLLMQELGLVPQRQVKVLFEPNL